MSWHAQDEVQSTLDAFCQELPTSITVEAENEANFKAR